MCCRQITIFYCLYLDGKRYPNSYSQQIAALGDLSRLILSFAKPLEDTVIAALGAEKELKEVLCNTRQELRMTLDKIKIKAEKDDFII